MTKEKACAALLAAALLLCACGGKTDRGLWPKDMSEAVLYRCDGENSDAWRAENAAQVQALCKVLRRCQAYPVKNWSADKLTYPVYGLRMIRNSDGIGINAAWTNGYLLMHVGTYIGDFSVYRCDIDFERLIGLLDSRNNTLVSEKPGMLPCAPWLCRGSDGWIAEHMAPAAEYTAIEAVTMTVTEQTKASLQTEIFNTAEQIWSYGLPGAYRLNVLLDGTWYHVPEDLVGSVCVAGIGAGLAPGERTQETVSLDRYTYDAALPEGHYRLLRAVGDGDAAWLCAEFDVGE